MHARVPFYEREFAVVTPQPEQEDKVRRSDSSAAPRHRADPPSQGSPARPRRRRAPSPVAAVSAEGDAWRHDGSTPPIHRTRAELIARIRWLEQRQPKGKGAGGISAKAEDEEQQQGVAGQHAPRTLTACKRWGSVP